MWPPSQTMSGLLQFALSIVSLVAARLYDHWQRLRRLHRRVRKQVYAGGVQLLRHTTAHDRHWRKHPAVATDDQLTIGQRAADVMRGALGTWTFLFLLAGIMALWIATGLFHVDPEPFILLNLCLSTLAGIQAAVLLIAAKRSDQIAAAVALHTLQNTEQLTKLIKDNTTLTKRLEQLNRQQLEILKALHQRPADQPPTQPSSRS